MTIRNVHGEPVPLIGGITSRNLFRDLFAREELRRVERDRYTPTRLWLAASIALVVVGILLL